MKTKLDDFGNTKNNEINMDTIFPLKVEEEDVYLGMGSYGSRFKLTTNDGKKICYSDYIPSYIEKINNVVAEYKKSETS